MKEKFIKSTIILVIGGFFTKVLGMIIRIIMTRIVGLNGIGLYMLILPTFNLFITIATLSFPVAISKVVAEDKKNNKNLLFSTIPLSIIINAFLILLLIVIAPYLTSNLLKDTRLYYPILAIGLVLPFISLSSIARGYFFGKEQMLPQIISNIFEQVVRLICMIIIIPPLLEKGIVFAITGLILINIISELLSIFILFFFLPKNVKITKNNLKIKFDIVKDVLSISIPTTLGRLIGSIGYFLEPIILTLVLLFVGYTNNYIITEYGIISGYVMPLLLMPSFLTAAISTALLPNITKNYGLKRIKNIKKTIKLATLLSFGIGLLATTIMMIFPELLLRLIYNTSHGATYLRILGPFFLIFYIQAPLASCLQALNKSKSMMIANLYGIIIKTIILILLSFLKIGMYPLIISIAFNSIFVTYLHYKDLKKALI